MTIQYGPTMGIKKHRGSWALIWAGEGEETSALTKGGLRLRGLMHGKAMRPAIVAALLLSK